MKILLVCTEPIGSHGSDMAAENFVLLICGFSVTAALLDPVGSLPWRQE